MHRYNPKTRTGEDRAPPETDEDVMNLLESDLNSMIFAGHEFRLRYLEHQPPG